MKIDIDIDLVTISGSIKELQAIERAIHNCIDTVQPNVSLITTLVRPNKNVLVKIKLET